MNRLLTIGRSLRKFLPKRPKRYWKYVSPGRRNVGLVILALLLVAFYAFWYITDDARIRRQARRYLREVTGSHVAIDHAEFRLFGDIELRGVRVTIPGENRKEPFFRARSVRLRHRPWSLFVSGQVEPTEIICIEPTVRIVHDQASDTYNFQKLFTQGSPDRGPREKYAGPLPIIRARGCKHKPVERIDGTDWEDEEIVWDLVMTPHAGKYDIRVTEKRSDSQKPTQGSMTLDVDTGDIRDFNMSGELKSLGRALRGRYAQWQKAYDFRGKIRVKASTIVAGMPEGLEVVMEGVTMKLPPAQGGYDLRDVRGTLAFMMDQDTQGENDSGHVRLKNVTGKLVEAGNAEFALSGDFYGYGEKSPFSVDVAIKGMQLPAGSMNADMAGWLKNIKESYRPVGKMDVNANVSRKVVGGRTYFKGEIFPKGLSLTYYLIPHRIDNVAGKILFNNDKIELKKLTAERDGGSIVVDGKLELVGGQPKSFALTAAAKGVWLSEELGHALRPYAGYAWDQLRPKGRIDAQVHVSGKDGVNNVDVRLTLISYGEARIGWTFDEKGKPYPLREVTGVVNVDNDYIWIDQDKPVRLRGNGKSRGSIYGTLKAPETKQADIKLYFRGSDFPMDDALAEAFGPKDKKAIKMLRLKGTADRLSARVFQDPGKDLGYQVDVNFENAQANYVDFPYQLTDVAGSLVIVPGRMETEGIIGRHGKTNIRMNGRMLFSDKGVWPDMKFTATGMELDKDAYDALASLPDLQRMWKDLELGGTADVALSLKKKMPVGDKAKEATAGGYLKDMDYRLDIQGRGMTVRYIGFPYRLENIIGSVRAVPGEVTLKDLKCAQGKMTTRMNGKIRWNGKKRSAEVAVLARGIPIDKKLFAAAPSDFAPVFDNVREGGTCDLDLTGRWKGTNTDENVMFSKDVSWNAAGNVWLKDAVIDIGIGPKRITGKLSGSLSQSAPVGAKKTGLAVDMGVELDRVEVAKRELTDVKGRLLKRHDSRLIEISDLTARAYKGRLFGREAFIRLTDPMKYSFRIFYENVDLGLLMNAGMPKDKKRNDISGLVSGDISYEAVAGKPETRQAVGTASIKKGKLYKMPVNLGMMHILNLELPGKAAFNKGAMTYRIQGKNLMFDELYLDGTSLSLLGKGVVDMDTEKVSMRFLAGPPGSVPRLKGLGADVVHAMMKEWLEIRVSGTLAKPKVQRVQLRSLRAILKALATPPTRNR